jgi:hypothetical protein
MSYLNAKRPEYPIQPIPSLFLPRFNDYNVDALASLDARPALPYQVAPLYVKSPQNRCNYKMVSSLPSGVGNFDRNSIRQFNLGTCDTYPYFYGKY